MKKKTAVLFAALTAMSLLAGCGSSESAGTNDAATSDAGSQSEKAEKGEISWSWGTLRGLYGDAEVTFNEDGGRETIVMNYPNGQPYRTIEYSYGDAMILDGVPQESYLSDKKVYPITKTTKDESGKPIYRYEYDWTLCQDSPEHWGAGIASDVTPILEAGELKASGNSKELASLAEIPERYFTSYEYGQDLEAEESTGNISYQELSHTTLGGSYMDIYHYARGYWLTMREGGKPVKTWFYAPDGRLDEDLTLTWTYQKGKPVSLQMGRYSMDVYTAEASEDGLTVTYTLDESHDSEGSDGQKKHLAQIYRFTLTYTEDQKPALFQYASSKEYLNEEKPQEKSYTITYRYENDVLSGAEYRIEQTDRNPELYTITCNAQGMLQDEERLNLTFDDHDIGSKSYAYYDSGKLKSITAYGDSTPGDPKRIRYERQYDESGFMSSQLSYDSGEPDLEVTYGADGNKTGATIYQNGQKDITYTVNEKGVYTFYEAYRDDGSVHSSGEMTGEQEFTRYGYNSDDPNHAKYLRAVYTYGENGYTETIYKEDGTVDWTKEREYNGKPQF